MVQILRKLALHALWLGLVPLSSFAATISYTTEQVTGNRWVYRYEISADEADSPVSEFTIFFDQNLFQQLAIISSPDSWDPLVIQPDAFLGSDGYFDGLALGSGISPGSTLGGFAVAFDYLGTGTPGTQRFDIIDSQTFQVVESGMTVRDTGTPPPTGIPEPAPLLLIGLPLIAIATQRRARPPR